MSWKTRLPSILFGPDAPGRPGIVDEDIELALAARQLFHQRLDARDRRQIALDADHPVAQLGAGEAAAAIAASWASPSRLLPPPPPPSLPPTPRLRLKARRHHTHPSLRGGQVVEVGDAEVWVRWVS